MPKQQNPSLADPTRLALVLKKFNKTVTLLKDLQLAIKPTLLRDFRSLLQWLESNNEMT